MTQLAELKKKVGKDNTMVLRQLIDYVARLEDRLLIFSELSDYSVKPQPMEKVLKSFKKAYPDLKPHPDAIKVLKVLD